MGFLRTSALVFVCILLFVSLLAVNITAVLFTSLKYSNVNNNVAPTLNEIVEEQVPEEIFIGMEKACEKISNYSFEYSELNFSLDIPCEKVQESRQAVINYSVNTFLEKTYYEEYNCDFWSCLTESQYPFVLFSEKAQEYWKSKVYLFLISSIILAVIALLLTKGKTNFLVILGALVVGSAIPLKFINPVISFFLPSMLENFVFSFLSGVNKIFLAILIIGFVLLATGIILKILETGDNLIDWIKKKIKKN